jgi:tRNA(Phe) wybutosine-synthesizing methylase Tyw3
MHSRGSKNNHKTQRISLKTIEVDKAIVPIVNWLNSFEDIFTLNSCEGEQRKGICNLPYIQFISMGQKDLSQILPRLMGYAEVTVLYDEVRGCLVYIARFKNKSAMERVVSLVFKGVETH